VHSGVPSEWTAEPVLLGVMALGTVMWLVGRRRLLAHPETAGAFGWHEQWWYVPAYAGAAVSMAAAAFSPIDEYSVQLFWVHMVQHLILLMLVAPLLVAAAPWLPLWMSLPTSLRNAIERRVSMPLSFGIARRVLTASLFLILFVVGTWIWHWPALYDLALRNDIVHDYGEHNIFLLAGMLFWLQLIPSAPFSPLLPVTGRLLFLAFAVIQNVVLSVVIGFAGHALYEPYAGLVHRPGGLSALADQQLGAAIMWSVGDLPFVIALIALIMTWLARQIEAAAPDGDGAPLASGRVL
jgi:cytochrome c oxidase assembly factor CtaG